MEMIFNHMPDFVNTNSILTTLISTALLAFCAYFRKKVKSIAKRMDAQDKGTVALLRMDLRKAGQECINRGWITYDELEDWTDMYNQYHSLGGNGTMENMKSRLEKLEMKGE